MHDHYLFLTNHDALVASERVGEYTITLPQALNLQGDWTCALKEISMRGSKNIQDFYIGVDFCEESVVGNKTFPVLRLINASQSTWIFSEPYYLTVTRYYLNNFKLFIKDLHLKELEFSGTLSCTIHLTPK